MLRWIGIGLLTFLGGVAGLCLVAWLALRAPAPLEVPPRGTLIPAATVIEPGGARLPGHTVVVEGARITEIRPATPEERAEAPAPRFVLPGLIDMHAHFPPLRFFGIGEHYALLFLRHGVTTVRDAGDVMGSATAPIQQAFRDESFPVPRVYSCGVFVDGPGSRWPNTEIVETKEEARAAVARIARAGHDCIKAYDLLSLDALAGVKEAAREHGLPVIGHVPYATRFEEAGFDDVQHLTGIPWGEGVRFPHTIPLWKDLPPERVDAVVRAAVEQDIAVTPTFVTRDRLGSWVEPDLLQWAPDAALLPRAFRDLVWIKPPWEEAVFRAFHESFEHEAALVRRLVDAGARVHVGTDALAVVVVPGTSMGREMRLFERAGIGVEEIWRLATRGNGASLPLPELGRLLPGAPADLLVFSSDPTRSLDALEDLELVVADGRPYPVPRIDEQLSRYEGHFRSAFFDRVLGTVVQLVVNQLFGGNTDPAD
ncbi:MAG: amidohydrolase family protein [Myxococcota bacterium]|nr:amidohydrolase family protein [Myxococcota bacterium]